MCQSAKPVRRVTLFEGQVKFIMERETPEERLAAIETIFAIAFPPDEEHKYVPPALPADGSRLSPCDRVRRDVYNFLKDVIERQGEKDVGKKDPKKVEAGRMGALMRFGDRGASSTCTIGEDTQNQKATAAITDDLNEVLPKNYKFKRHLTADDKAAIVEWDRKIPNAEALKSFLEKNYLFQNKKFITSDEFCAYAYQKLAKTDRWISIRDGKPLRDIRSAIHYMALDYQKKATEIHVAEEEMRRMEMESGFKTQTTQLSQQTPSELAAIERKRRRAAEREAMEKILKGEL